MARARADLAAGIAIFLLLLGVTLASGGPARGAWRACSPSARPPPA